MSEIRERILTAWHALRGRAVVRGMSIYHGEVTLHRASAYISGKSKIEDCQIWTLGPVRLVGNPPDAHNEGNALVEHAAEQ